MARTCANVARMSSLVRVHVVGGSCGIGCYSGNMDIEGNISNDDIENYDSLFKKFISQIAEGGPGTFSHLRWSSLLQ